MSATKKSIFTGLYMALGVLLPFAFHSIQGAGLIFLPMHIPVLLCGLTCGWLWGLACGFLTPLLSFLLTSMPAATVLPGLLPEFMIYGLTAGLLIKYFNTRSYHVAHLYLSLIGAMLCGRILSGILNAVIFSAGSYGLVAWLTASFITALPGIVIQLLLIPPLVLALRKLKLIA